MNQPGDLPQSLTAVSDAPHPSGSLLSGDSPLLSVVITLDSQGCVVCWSRAAEDLLGYAAQEIIRQPLSLLLSETELRRGVPEQILHTARLQGHYQGQTEWVDRYGNSFRGTVGITALLDPQGYLQGLAVVIQREPTSIHSSSQVEGGARTPTPEPYRDLIHSIDGIFWEAEAIGGHYSFVSPRAEQLLGYAVTEWLESAQFWIEHVHPEDQERVQEARAWMVSACLSGSCCRSSQEFEYRMIGTQGQVVWIQDKVTVIRNSDPPRLRGFMMDITRNKRQEHERARAEHLLRQQAQRERVIFQVSQRIRQVLDLDRVLNTTVQEVQKLLQTDRVLIYQFDPQTWSGRVRVEEVRQGWSSLLHTQIHDPCFGETSAQIDRHGRIQIISDIYTAELDPCYVNLLAGLQVRANLVVPIISDRQLWGLLIAHQCQGPRLWQIQDAQLLEQLANQVGIAIRQAELYQTIQALNHSLEDQVQERTQQLQHTLDAVQGLHRISHQICQTLDEHHILETAIHELGKTLQVDYGCVCFYGSEDQEAQVAFEYLPTAGLSNLGFTFFLNRFPQVYDQVLSGEVYLSPDPAVGEQITLDPGDLLCERPSLDPGTTLICPLVLQMGKPGSNSTEILGDIGLFTQSPRPFTESEIEWIQQVADQCVIGIRQARLYQASQRQVQVLERLHLLKDDFLSTISHELRTPMSNIKMAAFMLQQAPLELRYLNYLQIIERECTREISLINELLDLQKLESKPPELALESLDLNTWVQDLVKDFQAKLEQRQQWIEVELENDLPFLITDPEVLILVLAELINNACKYGPPESRIHLRVTSPTPHTLQFRVGNEGRIPEEEHDQIFERFYRIPNADPWKQGGTGLGLALVKKRLEHLKGTIRLIPDPEQVIFCCTLPLEEP